MESIVQCHRPAPLLLLDTLTENEEHMGACPPRVLVSRFPRGQPRRKGAEKGAERRFGPQ